MHEPPLSHWEARRFPPSSLAMSMSTAGRPFDGRSTAVIGVVQIAAPFPGCLVARYYTLPADYIRRLQSGRPNGLESPVRPTRPKSDAASARRPSPFFFSVRRPVPLLNGSMVGANCPVLQITTKQSAGPLFFLVPQRMAALSGTKCSTGPGS